MPDPFDFIINTLWIFFGPHVMCCRFSLTISLSTSSLVRLLTFFGARLLSSNPFIPPTAYLNSHLCPVLRVIPNSSHSSLTVNRPLCAKLINRCFCSIGNSFFQGILPSLCVTHVLGQFVTDLLGSYRVAPPGRDEREQTNQHCQAGASASKKTVNWEAPFIFFHFIKIG